MDTGVYQIKHLESDKIYIGSVAFKTGFTGRWSNHCSKLNKNRHHSTHLQHAWDKYGPEVFIFEILEECDPTLCIEREQYYLDTLLFASYNDKRFHQLGYNICRIAGSSLGRKCSDETKAKMKIARKGKYCGKDNFMFGKKLSDETKAKIGRASKGNKHNLGRKHSKKSRENMGKSHQGILSYFAKLIESNIHEIRILRQQGYTQEVVAKKFQVSRSTINHIDSGRTWSHI